MVLNTLIFFYHNDDTGAPLCTPLIQRHDTSISTVSRRSRKRVWLGWDGSEVSCWDRERKIEGVAMTQLAYVVFEANIPSPRPCCRDQGGDCDQKSVFWDRPRWKFWPPYRSKKFWPRDLSPNVSSWDSDQRFWSWDSVQTFGLVTGSNRSVLRLGPDVWLWHRSRDFGLESLTSVPHWIWQRRDGGPMKNERERGVAMTQLACFRCCGPAIKLQCTEHANINPTVDPQFH